MKKLFVLSATILFAINLVFSQGTAINSTGAPADNSAGLDVSFNNKGLLLPRMTTAERNAITSPAQSLMVFNTTTHCFETYDYNQWQTLWCTSCNITAPSASTHNPSQTQIEWNWNSVFGATGYKWSAVNDFNSALDMGTSLTKTETGLLCYTSYTRYVWSYNSCGHSSAEVLTQSTTSCPSSYQVFTSGGTFTPVGGVTSYRVLVVGGGGNGGVGESGGGGAGGGSGYITVGTYSVSSPVAVTVGSAGNPSSFGAFSTANQGNAGLGGSSCPPYGGNGGSGGGAGTRMGNGDGGNGGSGGSNGGASPGGGDCGGYSYLGGTGQGSYIASLSLFTLNTITAGNGGNGSSIGNGTGGNGYGSGGGGGERPSYGDAGGGAGGILINSAGPTAGNGNGTTSGGNGAAGVVYVEW